MVGLVRLRRARPDSAEVLADEIEKLGQRRERFASAGVQMLDAAADGLLGKPAAASDLNEKTVLGSDAAVRGLASRGGLVGF